MAIGGGARRHDLRPFALPRWAIAGIAVACVGFVGLLWLPYRAVTVLCATLVLLGSLCFVAGVMAALLRAEIRRAGAVVAQAMSDSALSALPPARALESVLGRVYGDSGVSRDIVTSLLGGEGLALDGGDATISEHTEINFELSRVDLASYRLVMEQRYAFRSRVPTTQFVIFATSDTALRDNIIAGCRQPLFELWFVRDEPARSPFEESVENMRETVRIGMRYVDERDSVHTLPPQIPGTRLREVMLQDWGKYLSFFRTDLQGETGLDRRHYMGKLRIFEVDLRGFAPADQRVVTIEELAIRSTTLQLIADGFCYWQAPFPCYVERMTFDTASFDLQDGSRHWFHLKPFTMTTAPSLSRWSGGDGVAEVPLGTWLFPGHGMALMWRELT
jgi:hypothetical protein